MAKVTLYVSLKQKGPDEYCSIASYRSELYEIEEEYNWTLGVLEKFEADLESSLKDFSRKYIEVDVEYDGRRNYIGEAAIMARLVNMGIIEKVGDGGLFGGHYKIVDFSKVENEVYMHKALF